MWENSSNGEDFLTEIMNMQMETSCIFISHQIERKKKKAQNVTDVLGCEKASRKRSQSTLVKGN